MMPCYHHNHVALLSCCYIVITASGHMVVAVLLNSCYTAIAAILLFAVNCHVVIVIITVNTKPYPQ